MINQQLGLNHFTNHKERNTSYHNSQERSKGESYKERRHTLLSSSQVLQNGKLVMALLLGILNSFPFDTVLQRSFHNKLISVIQWVTTPSLFSIRRQIYGFNIIPHHKVHQPGPQIAITKILILPSISSFLLHLHNPQRRCQLKYLRCNRQWPLCSFPFPLQIHPTILLPHSKTNHLRNLLQLRYNTRHWRPTNKPSIFTSLVKQTRQIKPL
ncbi:hypothetical protein LguiB_033993 [Lonicera macranthoides]